jgi:hypothetical protein
VDHGFVVCWQAFVVADGAAAPGDPRQDAIKRNGSLVLIGSFAIKGGGANIDARLSPDGKYLLVNGSGPHLVSVFAVNGGNLTEVPSSPTPLPAGATSSSGIVNT